MAADQQVISRHVPTGTMWHRPGWEAGSAVGLRILRELDGGGGAGGEVLDQEPGWGEVGEHPEEAVALGDLLRGRRGEEIRAAAGLLLAAGHVGPEQPFVA